MGGGKSGLGTRLVLSKKKNDCVLCASRDLIVYYVHHVTTPMIVYYVHHVTTRMIVYYVHHVTTRMIVYYVHHVT